jgi:hypothetical protein
VRGSYRRDVFGIKRRFLYVQKPPNRHRLALFWGGD